MRIGVSQRPRSLRFTAALTGVALVAGGLISCQGSSPADEDENVELTIARVNDTGTMNPFGYDSDMGMQSLVYEPLVELNDEGDVEPWLAEEWEFDDDHKTIIFTLRDGVTFSDGSPLNAEAVKASVDAVFANKERHAWLPLVEKLEDIEVIDDMTVAYHFEEVYPFALLELSMVRPMRIMSPNGLDGTEFVEPIGTGPFTLTDYVVDESTTFVRNDDYWGDKPQINTLNIKIVPDSNTRLQALLGGEVDVIVGRGGTDSLPFTDLETIEAAPNLTLLSRDGDIAEFVSLNPSDPLLEDVRVRQAVVQAIDANEINDVVYGGNNVVATTMASASIPEVTGDSKTIGYDPDAARKLLDQAGWKANGENGTREKNGETLTLSYNLPSETAGQKSVGEIIQAQLADIGVEMELSAVEETVYYERKNNTGEYSLMPDISWGVQYDPHTLYKAMRDTRDHLAPAFESGAGDLLTEVLNNTDETSRRKQQDEIADILMNEEFLVAPLTISPNIAAVRDGVEGFELPKNIWELRQSLMTVTVED